MNWLAHENRILSGVQIFVLGRASCGFPWNRLEWDSKGNEIWNKFHLPFFCSLFFGIYNESHQLEREERSSHVNHDVATMLSPFSQGSKSLFRSRLLSHRWQVEMKGTGCYELPGKSTSALSWPFNRFLPFLIFITLTQDINYRTHDRERSKNAMTWSTPHNSKWSNCWHLLESRWTIEI